jgi:hypothetical protein
MLGYNSRFSESRGGGSLELIDAVKRSIVKPLKPDTGARKPGILLGKVQSGKPPGLLGLSLMRSTSPLSLTSG